MTNHDEPQIYPSNPWGDHKVVTAQAQACDLGQDLPIYG